MMAATNWTLQGTINPTPAGFTVPSDLCGDPYDPNVVLIAAYPTYTSNRQHGYVWRSGDGGQTWTHIRDQMFSRHWRVGDGGWLVWNQAMKQDYEAYCNYRTAIDNQTFGNGTFECRMRITASKDNDPANWVGFTIRMNTPNDAFGTSGWLVFMRKNGAVVLYNPTDGAVINTGQVPIVGDTSQWVSVRLSAVGNTFELLVNGTSIGTYTDANHRFDGAGYFGFVTCRTDAEYDDLVIQTEQSYTDNFNVAAQYGGYLGRWLTADPRTPGVFGLSTQGGGVWRSVDHGLTWQRITDTSGEGLVNYRPRYGNTRQSLRVPRERLFLGDR